MSITELLTEIKNITDSMFETDSNVYEKYKQILPHIQQYYQELIQLIPSLNGIGMNIDMNMVVGQLKNISDAIENRDKVKLYDTLRYEMTDTLSVYKEIKDIVEQG